MFSNFIPFNMANLAAFFLFLLAVLWRRYTAKCNAFIAYKKRDSARGTPFTFPYAFPLLGSLPIAYLWNPRDFVLNPR